MKSTSVHLAWTCDRSIDTWPGCRVWLNERHAVSSFVLYSVRDRQRGSWRLQTQGVVVPPVIGDIATARSLCRLWWGCSITQWEPSDLLHGFVEKTPQHKHRLTFPFGQLFLNTLRIGREKRKKLRSASLSSCYFVLCAGTVRWECVQVSTKSLTHDRLTQPSLRSAVCRPFERRQYTHRVLYVVFLRSDPEDALAPPESPAAVAAAIL